MEWTRAKDWLIGAAGMVLVLAIAMGGDAGVPGRRVAVDEKLLKDVFVAQVAKVKAAGE